MRPVKWQFPIALVLALQSGAIREARGEDLVVLFDVSRSMRQVWLEPGKAAVVDLLRTGQTPSNWTLLNPTKDAEAYSFWAQRTPILRSGDKLLVMSFGTITDVMPYFTVPPPISIADINQAASHVAASAPTQVRDPWTYLELAEAVSWQTLKQQRNANRNAPFLILIVSDLIEDREHELTIEQSALISQFEREQRCAGLTFQYNNDPSLKMRLYEVGGNCIGDARVTLVSPLEDANWKERDKLMPFIARWWGQPDASIQYTFVVRKKEGRVWKVKNMRQQPQPQLFQKLESGQYQTYVLCNTPWGSYKSDMRNFQVADSPLPWKAILLTIAALFLLAIGISYASQMLPGLFRRKPPRT